MLKTEFLGLNYHPNPATNTDEVDAEKYFNENYFTIEASKLADKNKINAIDYEELITYLAEEQAKFIQEEVVEETEATEVVETVETTEESVVE